MISKECETLTTRTGYSGFEHQVLIGSTCIVNIFNQCSENEFLNLPCLDIQDVAVGGKSNGKGPFGEPCAHDAPYYQAKSQKITST